MMSWSPGRSNPRAHTTTQLHGLHAAAQHHECLKLKLTCWSVYAHLKLAHSVLHISNSLQNF
uniref:Uncharacterized protein n=1 Tax=Aegilops tauschii subsp. strangulata TaxID=200361 RepID=A0A453HAY2_AEGTS